MVYLFESKNLSTKYVYFLNQAETNLSTNNRIAVVDFLRGISLLFVVISNFMAFQNIEVLNSGLNSILNFLDRSFGKTIWISLSFLFGFGFWNLIQKTQNKHRFFNRLFWLLVFGILNSCLYFGDFLKDFALTGIFCLLALYISNQKLFKLTIILTFLIPIIRVFTIRYEVPVFDFRNIESLFESSSFKDIIQYNLSFIKAYQFQSLNYLIGVHFEMICAMFWGILANRNQFFSPKNSIWKKIFGFSLFVICFIISLKYLTPNSYKSINSFYNLWSVQNIVYSAFLIASFTLFYFKFQHFKLFQWIEIYGKMTLSNYIGQSLFMLILFYGIGFHLGKNQPLYIYFSWAILIYFIQLIFSVFWLKHFKLGPIEWIWRSLSERKLIPLKK